MKHASTCSCRAIVAFALCALAVAACGREIDRAAKADIDRRIAMLPSSSASVPPPTSWQRIRPAVGHWARYKVIDPKGRPAFATYKIVAQDGDAFWIEVLRETYFGPNTLKLLVAFGNGVDPNDVDLRAMFVRNRKGHVYQMPLAEVPSLRASMKLLVSSWIMTWHGLPQQDEVVPAGRFEGCFHAHAVLQAPAPAPATAHASFDSWSHPAVPLPGFVRQEGAQHRYTMELVAFGLTGATPSF